MAFLIYFCTNFVIVTNAKTELFSFMQSLGNYKHIHNDGTFLFIFIFINTIKLLSS